MYDKGKGLPFHFDKDEHMFKEEGKMVHPLASSILYLTGQTTSECSCLGETTFFSSQVMN